jgi:hypothetical protein
MSAESLTYAELAGGLGTSRKAARSLVRRIKLPRQTSDDSTARISVDVAQSHHKPLRRSQGSHDPVDFDTLKGRIEQLQAEVNKLEMEKSAIQVIAADYRADFERERERGDKLLTNTMATRSGGNVSTSKGSAIRERTNCATVSVLDEAPDTPTGRGAPTVSIGRTSKT